MNAVSRLCALAAIALAWCSFGAFPASADVALWALQGPGGGRAVLMGTIHLLPDEPVWQTKRIKRIVKQSDMLVLEALLDGPNMAQVRAVSMAKGFYTTAGEGLSTILSPEDQSRLAAIEAELDVPAGVFERMKPWFAGLNMSIAYAMNHGFEPDSGAEQWLRQRFAKRGRPIGPLEGAAAGLSALSRMPPAAQLEMLRGAMAQVEAGDEDITQLHRAWLAGDVRSLEALVLAEHQFDARVHDVILTQRNASWIIPLLDYLKTPEQELIAVGAAHMVGPGNLIEMLEAAGVTVKRLE